MSEFVHGDNLTKKEKDSDTTAEQLKLLKKIRKEYNKWNQQT